MTDQALEAMLYTLFTVISSIHGYEMPETYPTVRQMPRIEIAMRVCGKDCAVSALYTSADGVMIDEAFDLQHDAFGQSVLVHELVHFLQDSAGTFAEYGPCRRQNEREREAYYIQYQYLDRIGRGTTSGLYYTNRLWPRCFDE
jgi:hypothetical protein